MAKKKPPTHITKTTTPPTNVVALQYEGYKTPRLTAKGKGVTATNILAVAEQYNIPLYQDAELTHLLSQLDLGEQIPENLYLAVAKVIAFAYTLTGKLPHQT
ncbi:MAG: EscU/YscU/HrcU family type III secretion system export apparatus switch protein [Gammaproteobacteria bacterium]